MKGSNLDSDPFYRTLLADIADTEWQAVESDFLRGRDDAEVSLRDERDAEFWTLELGVSERELWRAIEAVGPLVRNLQAHLTRC
jgi:hypothetical protein